MGWAALASSLLGATARGNKARFLEGIAGDAVDVLKAIWTKEVAAPPPRDDDKDVVQALSEACPLLSMRDLFCTHAT